MAQPPLLPRLRRLWSHEIWAAGLHRDRSFKGRSMALLRIASITLSGLQELKVAPRAAALSYSSLLGLGPLITIVVLISGFALGDRDPALVANGVNNVINFIAPQVGQYQRAVSAADARNSAQSPELRALPQTGEKTNSRVAADPELVKVINNFVTTSHSGTAGVVGIVALLVIVILLFTSVEKTFNDIWGVRRGRNWLTRVVYYWAVITVGAALFFASLTLFSAGTFIKVYTEKLPLQHELAPVYAMLLRSSSAVLLVIILTLFYRLTPNTRVKWTAALIGAIIVTLLLFLNNYLAFLYFRNVVSTNRLYGAVGIVPILMLGLYVFWLFVLVGGQITYAVQNVHYRSSQTAWHSLNHATRESMSLLVLLLVARRFKVCAPPYSVAALSQLMRVPSQILNESLNRLCDLKLIVELPPADGTDPADHRYQPARPLNSISLVEFRNLFENYGESPSGGLLDNVDPVLALYHERLTGCLPQALGDKTLDQLIDEQQPSQTYAPFPQKSPAN
ncbi:MAG TPA: YihY/virulence factor BrkB family protein [Lacunisphaera sp.]|jgi:membrane protein